MRMPRGPKLDRLIRFPVEWNQFYLRMEEERRLPELLEALEELPESSVRDVRIARICFRMGRRQEAKDLVYQHKRCPLARAFYFSFLVRNVDEETLRKFVENYKPLASLGNSTLNLEAKYHDHMNMAVAAHVLGKIQLANKMYFEAMQIAKIMKDTHSERIIKYNIAWMRFYEGKFKESLRTFEEVLKSVKPTMNLYNQSMEYISWISWLTGEVPRYAPRWMQSAIELSKNAEDLDENIDYPDYAAVPYMIPIMNKLQVLTKEFNLRLPLMHVGENRLFRDELIDKIRTDVGEDVGEIMGFLSRSMLSLAVSMQQNRDSVHILKSAFKWPTTGIPLMSMIYFSSLIQIHANLPDMESGQDEVKNAFNLLLHQMQFLEKGQKDWLMIWMKNFTPVPLYLLSEKLGVYPAPHDYVIVKPEGVYRGSETVARYPRFFMVRHVRELLSGGKIPDNNRKQAYRHFEALQAIGSPLVIYEPIVEPFRKLLH